LRREREGGDRREAGDQRHRPREGRGHVCVSGPGPAASRTEYTQIVSPAMLSRVFGCPSTLTTRTPVSAVSDMSTPTSTRPRASRLCLAFATPPGLVTSPSPLGEPPRRP